MNLGRDSRVPDWTSIAGLAVVVAVALGIRLYRLGYDPLWLDEAWSLWFAQQSWIYLWTEVPTFDTHPPTFYSLLKLWTIFGVDEFSLRLLPAIFGTATAGITYLICRIALPRGTSSIAGLTAGLFAAAHPLQIHYSQEIREYSMFAFAYAVLLAGCVWLAANIRQAGLPWWGARWSADPANDGSKASLAWLAVVVGGSFCLWSSNTGAIFLASSGLPLAAITLRSVWRRETSSWAIYNGIGCAFVVLLSWAPWIPILTHQVGVIPEDFWLRLDIHRILRTAGDFLTFSFPGDARLTSLLLYGFLPCGLVSLAIVYLIRQLSRVGLLLTTSLLFPPLVSIVVSLVLQPIFLTRALLAVTVPFSVLIGFGIQSIWDFKRTAAMPVMVALAMMTGIGAWNYATAENATEPWRDVAQVIADDYKDGDVILALPNFLEFPLRYYLQDSPQTHYHIEGIPKPYPALHSISARAFRNIDLEPWFREAKGVWLVIRKQPKSTRDVETLKRANQLGKQVLQRQMGPLISVYYFRRVENKVASESLMNDSSDDDRRMPRIQIEKPG